MTGGLRAAAAVVSLVIVCAPAPIVGQSATGETRLKAAFVSKFPQFVEWPPAALQGRKTVDICVTSPDPFGVDLDELVAGESLNGRGLIVRHVDRDGPLERCHVLFVPTSGTSARALLGRTAALPILTVGEEEKFLEEGGVIRLRMIEGRVRFDVNATAARKAGLRLSSQLLQLAINVRGGRP